MNTTYIAIMFGLLITFLICICIKKDREIKELNSQLHEYQLEIEIDSFYVYDRDRLVGVYPWGYSLDSIIQKDNQ